MNEQTRQRIHIHRFNKTFKPTGNTSCISRFFEILILIYFILIILVVSNFTLVFHLSVISTSFSFNI